MIFLLQNLVQPGQIFVASHTNGNGNDFRRFIGMDLPDGRDDVGKAILPGLD